MQSVQRGYKIIEVDSNFFIIKHYTDEIFENGIQCRDRV
mgnify:FL=1